MGITMGFDVLASTVVLLGSANYMATMGKADYAAEFVRASGMLRGAFTSGVTVLHSILFLLGGTHNTSAIRTMAEVEHWIRTVTHGIDDISAARNLFASNLRTLSANSSSTSTDHLIRLPSSLTSTEKLPFIFAGLDNLKMAVEPVSEEDEKSLLVLLLEELNNLLPVNLCTDIVCDRYLDHKKDVFADETMDRGPSAHWRKPPFKNHEALGLGYLEDNQPQQAGLEDHRRRRCGNG
jgi:hypothetical protein